MIGKELVCMVCPNSCIMHLEERTVTGNRCPRGAEFAEAEMTNPMRMICTTISGQLPVKLSAKIPKDKVFEAMKEIKSIVVTPPVCCGDIVLENLLDLGADVVAAADL